MPDMNSSTQDWKCSKCNSNNAYYRDFQDDESGIVEYTFECRDCKYKEFYSDKEEKENV